MFESGISFANIVLRIAAYAVSYRSGSFSTSRYDAVWRREVRRMSEERLKRELRRLLTLLPLRIIARLHRTIFRGCHLAVIIAAEFLRDRGLLDIAILCDLREEWEEIIAFRNLMLTSESEVDSEAETVANYPRFQQNDTEESSDEDNDDDDDDDNDENSDEESSVSSSSSDDEASPPAQPHPPPRPVVRPVQPVLREEVRAPSPAYRYEEGIHERRSVFLGLGQAGRILLREYREPTTYDLQRIAAQRFAGDPPSEDDDLAAGDLEEDALPVPTEEEVATRTRARLLRDFNRRTVQQEEANGIYRPGVISFDPRNATDRLVNEVIRRTDNGERTILYSGYAQLDYYARGIRDSARAREIRWFNDLVDQYDSPLYTEVDLPELLSRVEDSFASPPEA